MKVMRYLSSIPHHTYFCQTQKHSASDVLEVRYQVMAENTEKDRY